MKYPLVQLSQFKTPVIGRGRPYTVDFGIAKPLYKQLLSKLVSGAHPRWQLITRNRASNLLTWGLISIYGVVALSFLPSQHITYADPILAVNLPMPAQLTMPVISHIEPLQSIVTPLSVDLPNSFVGGQCTFGVASRLPITWSGDANMWAANAAAQGYTVSNIPQVGSIAQTSGDSYAGHVGIILELYPDGSFLVWEMNGPGGPWTTDERVTNTSEFQNFIYI